MTHTTLDAEPHRPAITATLERIAEAWNAGDAAAYAAEFTEDASYVAFHGQIMRGRPEIEHVHRMLFDGPLRGSHMEDLGSTTGTGVPPRLVRPGVAVVVEAGGIRLDGAAELTDDRRSVLTFVLVEEEGGVWRIAAFQNTRQQVLEGGPGMARTPQ
ncbi:SgcJ/EcaC family oxidoreductase [Streptomyces sp. NPDC048172]|uniref:SgcJ/EcaC family oxidoreductase n=1 Tax=Streptomyces sp. NPDC048172 TaxID=3365505 RepID=UPI003716804B